MGTVAQQVVAIDIERRPAETAAFQLGPPHAGPYSLDNKVAFQLGDGADDDDQGATQRPAGVDVLPERDELDPEPVELVEYLQQVAYGSGLVP